jgi:hypothetical protein
MKTTCKKCGESFTIDKESEELIEDGYYSLADASICIDCFESMQNTDFEYEQYSDADNGL